MNLSEQKGSELPSYAGVFGLLLFLAALFMLFAAGLVGYIIIRVFGDASPPLHSVTLPWGLWVSTIAIVASSFTIHSALSAVRAGRQAQFRNMMWATFALSLIFVAIQFPCLVALQREHWVQLGDALQGGDHGIMLYGLIFMLILLHALHVLGGWIPMLVSTVRASKGKYTKEDHSPIRCLAIYWHFLDAVWIVMFVVFLALG